MAKRKGRRRKRSKSNDRTPKKKRKSRRNKRRATIGVQSGKLPQRGDRKKHVT